MPEGNFGMDLQKGAKEIGNKMVVDFVRCCHIFLFAALLAVTLASAQQPQALPNDPDVLYYASRRR
jgi:hypothetical protein